MKSFYEWLKVKRDASYFEIEDAYYVRKQQAQQKTKPGKRNILLLNVEKGYRILSNHDLRLKYDSWLMLKEHKAFSWNKSEFIIIALLSIALLFSWIYILSLDFANDYKNKNLSETFNSEILKEDFNHSNIEVSVVSDDLFSEDEDDEVAKLTDDSNDNSEDYYGDNTVYAITNFKTGESPYKSYFGKGNFNNNSLSELLVENFSKLDAVLLLITIKGKVIRNVFIASNMTYTIKNIPSSNCYLKVMMGNDWNADKYNGPNFPKGGFMKNLTYSESAKNDPFDFTPITKTESIVYPTYSVTLHKVANGNLKSEEISEQDFFEL